MTPKEKADELVIKMYQPLPASKESVKGKEHLYYNQFSAAKQCALISVNEILNAWPHKYDLETEYFRDGEPISVIRNIKSNIAYWQEVKQEIEKL
jgi:hypothetical protein